MHDNSLQSFHVFPRQKSYSLNEEIFLHTAMEKRFKRSMSTTVITTNYGFQRLYMHVAWIPNLI